MAFVQLADGELHYEIEGPAEAPVLVLSNSLGTDLHMWDAQMPAFAEHFRVLRFDTRGHGQSLVTEGRTASNNSVATCSVCSMRCISSARISAGCRWAG